MILTDMQPSKGRRRRLFMAVWRSVCLATSIWLITGNVLFADNHDQTTHRSKHAIIVAISEYSDRRWETIHSTNDIPLIKEALYEHDFPAENIVVVMDRKATREGIEREISQKLLPRIKPGDVIYFHFSGHGQRIRDDDCDEEDGYDEALVPHDAPKIAPTNYTGDKHLRDDDVEQIINSLRAAAGLEGDVIVALDSCFSGTAAKGIAPHRGSVVKIGEAQQCESTVDTKKSAIRLESKAGMAPYVVFSASRFHELARETRNESGEYVGSLSLALASNLSQLAEGTTYRKLFFDVRKYMTTVVRNVPQLAGDVDREIFGGLAVDQAPFFEVDRIEDNWIRIRAGTLRGVLNQSVVEFHQQGALKPLPSTFLAKGEVKFAGDIYSYVELDSGGAPSPSLLSSLAFVTNAVFGDLVLRVKIISDDAAFNTSLRSVIESSLLLAVADGADAVIEIRDHRASNGTVTLVDPADESIVNSFSMNEQNLAQVVFRGLQAFAKNRYLRKLKLRSAGISGELEIYYCELECVTGDGNEDEECHCNSQTRLVGNDERGNEIQLVVGENYRFRIRNTGTKRTYNYLLALISSGEIIQMYPWENHQAQYLARNKSYEIETIFGWGPPLGTDVLMLVSSLVPIDFWPILQHQRSASRSAKGPFDLLWEDSLLGHRGDNPRIPLGTASANATAVSVVSKE